MKVLVRHYLRAGVAWRWWWAAPRTPPRTWWWRKTTSWTCTKPSTCSGDCDPPEPKPLPEVRGAVLVALGSVPQNWTRFGSVAGKGFIKVR